MPAGTLRVSDFRTVCPILGVALALAALLAATSQASAAADSGRERCRELRERGPRAAAIAACDEVVQLEGSAEDMWAASAARVVGGEAPTMDDLIRADVLASAAIRLAPSEPWGYLAQVEIARRWGDPQWIERRLHDLERAAPGHPQTAHALARARPAIHWGRVATAGALALLCALTVARSLRRLLCGQLRRRGRARAAQGLLVAMLLLWRPGLAAAAAFSVDDADPERVVPTQAQADASPLEFAYYLQDLTERAEAAARRGDHRAASRYFRAMARAVPDSSLPHQQLCASLVALGDTGGAIAACQQALGLPGVRAEDFQRFAELVLGTPAATRSQLDDVAAAARHLAAQPATRAPGLQLLCRLAVRIDSVPLLEECTGGLAAATPADATTHVYQWSLALHQGKRDEARQHIAEARAAGLGEEALARMDAATPDAPSRARWMLVAGFALAAVGSLVLVRRRLRAAQWTTTISGSS
jgi:hypothetical protein